jgi:hexosaminidase
VLDHEPTAFTAGHRVWLDPDLAATYEVIEEVLSQVANLFPGPFLHIGGDEPFGMPEDLYVAYVRHIIRFVRSIGKRTVGFQETMRAGVDPNHVIQYWISPDTEAMVNIGRARADIEQAKARGVRIIVTPMSHAYLDVAYAEPSADPSQEAIRLRVGQRVYSPKTVAETFDWEPVEALGPNTRPEHLAGVGAAIGARQSTTLTS